MYNDDAAIMNDDDAAIMNDDSAAIMNDDSAAIMNDDSAAVMNDDSAAIMNNDSAAIMNNDDSAAIMCSKTLDLPKIASPYFPYSSLIMVSYCALALSNRDLSSIDVFVLSFEVEVVGGTGFSSMTSSVGLTIDTPVRPLVEFTARPPAGVIVGVLVRLTIGVDVGGLVGGVLVRLTIGVDMGGLVGAAVGVLVAAPGAGVGVDVTGTAVGATVGADVVGVLVGAGVLISIFVCISLFTL